MKMRAKASQESNSVTLPHVVPMRGKTRCRKNVSRLIPTNDTAGEPLKASRLYHSTT